MTLICTIIFYLTILLWEVIYMCKSCILIGSRMYGSFVWRLWVLCLSYKSFRISPCQNFINISTMHTDCILWYVWNLLWYGMRSDPSSLHPTPIQWQSDTICWITCLFSECFEINIYVLFLTTSANSVALNVFTLLYNHHYYLSNFSPPQTKLYTHYKQ